MTKNWEKEKERMHELYITRNMKLASVIDIMIKEYGFQASERAYKQKFKEWQWFKKTQRNPCVQNIKQGSMSPMDDPSDHNPPRSSADQRHHHQHPPHHQHHHHHHQHQQQQQQQQQQHHLYRIPHQRSQSRVGAGGVGAGGAGGMASPMEHTYTDQYSHIPFETHHYPVVTGVDLDVYGGSSTQQQHHLQQAAAAAAHHMGPPPSVGGVLGAGIGGGIGTGAGGASGGHGGMTLGPYGRGGVVAGSQVSLPSVSALQRATSQRASFSENLREAERRVDVGQYDHAESALGDAMRNLHWLKETNN